jgi:hypothetical protein
MSRAAAERIKKPPRHASQNGAEFEGGFSLKTLPDATVSGREVRPLSHNLTVVH